MNKNNIQNKNYDFLKDLKVDKATFKDLKPCYYSYGKGTFGMINNLKRHERESIKILLSNFISRLHSFRKLNLKYNRVSFENTQENLISNLYFLIDKKADIRENEEYLRAIFGIFVILSCTKRGSDKAYKLMRDILYFDKTVESYTNQRLLCVYKKTVKNYNALSLIENKTFYEEASITNSILDTKRKDILNEFNKRSRLAKICDIVDKNDNFKGIGYFIPKMIHENDKIIVIFNNEPYSLNDFKKNKLYTKKVNGRISWH